MHIITTLQNEKIKITEPLIRDTYFIEQNHDKRFYVTSDNGYNGFEGKGFKELEHAIRNVKEMIKDYFIDRSEENPKGW